MKIHRSILMLIILGIGTGCKQGNADIRATGPAEPEVRSSVPSVEAEGPEMRVVTGEPAKMPVVGRASDGATAEDKAGTVALKVQY